MAKEFAKLSKEEKINYLNMAQKSKNEISSATKMPSALTSKAKTSKTAESFKEVNGESAIAATATALKLSERGSSPLTFAANTDSKSVKSPSKYKPTLNAQVKATAEASSKTLKYPVWASYLPLFKAEKMHEPPKPPE